MGRSCFPPRAGGQNYSHARTTRLHYNLLYIPHVTVYLDRSDLLSRELMYDTLYPSKRAGGLRRYARYCIFLTSWQSLKEKSYQLAFQKHITGHHESTCPHKWSDCWIVSSRRELTEILERHRSGQQARRVLHESHVTILHRSCNSRSQKSVSTGTRAPPLPPLGPPRHHNRLSRWDLGRVGALVSRTRGLMVMNERVAPSQGWNPR